jgi:hypothetical protein
MVVYMKIRPEVARWRNLLSAWDDGRLTGRRRSLSHQTISEHVFGSGAMTSTGSASTRHSHKLHSAGRQFAKARRGVDGGSDASI